jgi:hypothetical protein
MSFHTVGTAPDTVGFSAMISLQSGSPCRNRFGITKSEPVIQPA